MFAAIGGFIAYFHAIAHVLANFVLAVVIAAITSCTNTSNPSVMIGAALLAKKAVEKGLAPKPWVKTTLAPGSRVVTEYLEAAGLQQYLDQIGFNTVGYGCMTCIGNSGPLPEPTVAAINEGDLVVASVLMALGMMMVPPATISLPFKLMLFVLVDGWQLLLGSLAQSFV